MKRVPLWIVLSLLLLSIMPLLPAHHNPTSISALIYNDAFSMGIWDNKDDFRSYGIDLSFTHSNRWFGKVELSGLTLREKERRYDEISLLGGRYFDNHIISKEGIVSSQSIL